MVIPISGGIFQQISLKNLKPRNASDVVAVRSLLTLAQTVYALIGFGSQDHILKKIYGAMRFNLRPGICVKNAVKFI
jgi:hypothetical protein